MTLRVCATPGCPTLTPPGTRGGHCTTHQRQADKARGTKTQRGYDTNYLNTRQQWATHQAAGNTLTCWRCQQPINGDFHLGHDDNNRDIIRGPEHPSCNLTTAAQQRHNT